MKGILPSLHQAVIEGDLTSVNRLKADPVAIAATDALGFTALELAQLLNRRSAASILNPSNPPTIKAIPKGGGSLLKLSPQEFRDYFNVVYVPHLVFADYDELRKVLEYCPWVLAKSIFGEENRLQGIEYSPQLQAGRCADISIRWIDEILGYGIFADVDLPPGTYVGEFTGVVRELSRKILSHNTYCFHYPTRFWSWHYYAIDALNMGNETRFLNHSDRPNLTPLCLCERRLLHIVFISKTSISAGTQLTYDYGKDFWKRRKKIEI